MTDDAYGLEIFLVEDKVAGFPRANYASINTLFQKYEAYMPSMIENILHENVARDAIAPLIGGLNIPTAASKNAKVYKNFLKQPCRIASK